MPILDAARTARTALSIAAAGAVLLSTRAAAQSTEPQRDTVSRTSIQGDYEHTRFSGGAGPWRLASIALAHRAPAGSLIGRVNAAHRFDQDGVQYEIDAYPRFGGGRYLYVNAGYSAASIFPRWRSGAELYTNLPRATEASLGYRQLRFAGAAPVTLFTGTVGKYTGNHWFSLRPWLYEKSDGVSASATLTGRRYFADAENFVGARLGYGTTPSDRVTASELARTSATTMDVHGSRRLAPHAVAIGTIGHERERLPGALSRTRWTFSGGLRYDF